MANHLDVPGDDLTLDAYAKRFEEMRHIQEGKMKRITHHRAYAVLAADNDYERPWLRRGPSNMEQLIRNEDLNEAVQKAALNSTLQARILEVAIRVLEAKSPPERFNLQGFAEAKLTTDQVNDLVTNFIIWTVQHDERFRENHRVIFYLHVFGGLDAQGVEEKVKKFEETDGMTYGVTSQSTQGSFREIIEIFRMEGSHLLQRFLQNVSLNDSTEGTGVSVPRSGPEPQGDREAMGSPQSEFELCFDMLDIMLLQRGNISARNKIFSRILSLVDSFVFKKKGPYWVENFGVPEDYYEMRDWVVEKCIEKLAHYEPKRGAKLSTFMIRCIRSFIRTYGKERMGVVRTPRNAPQNGHQALSIHRPRHSPAQKEGRPLEEELPELHSPPPINNLLEKERAYTLGRILVVLPRPEGYILQRTVLEDASNEEVGKELGISRETVRKKAMRMMDKLRNGKEIENGITLKQSEEDKRFARARELLRTLDQKA